MQFSSKQHMGILSARKVLPGVIQEISPVYYEIAGKFFFENTLFPTK